MGGAPSTVAQLALIVIAVLPGVTYQFVRERQRGSLPGEQDLTERVLRALTASVALDALYVVVLAPWIVRIATDGLRITKNAAQLRWVGLMCLVLIFLIPAVFAWCISVLHLRSWKGIYVGTPSAWDHVFQNLPASFIRARMKDSSWVGGWYGPNSFVTAYPRPPEIYLEIAWRMGGDGSFIAAVERTQGIIIAGADIDLLEIVEN
ncbi:DUF6338 family protein [Streptomyces sp. NPDC020802]|uniref:DUF6338 family protein n=1 Tax=Streptomyces sp. NPDC020802 TaxID=3365094 RepID=UPI0037AB4563